MSKPKVNEIERMVKFVGYRDIADANKFRKRLDEFIDDLIVDYAKVSLEKMSGEEFRNKWMVRP